MYSEFEKFIEITEKLWKFQKILFKKLIWKIIQAMSQMNYETLWYSVKNILISF